MLISKQSLLAFLPFLLQTEAQASGSGKTTRYWDCCKPSCAWVGKTPLSSDSNPVSSCDANDNPVSSLAKSGCDSGNSYMCTNQSPWAVSDTLSYGFAAVSISGGTESSWCCACYELTFTSGPASGKRMIVQATNTGGDLGTNHFDIAMPGGGFGIFNGCSSQWGNAPSWGAQYGGVSSRSQCDTFPEKLKAGCYWRFDWFLNSDNPAVNFKQITCPASLTGKTGCVRQGENPSGGTDPTYVPGVSSTKVSSSTSSVKPTSSSTSSIVRTTSTSTRLASTSTKAPASSSTPGGGGGTVGPWGQCGGNGYTGPTVCVAPYTCKYSNDWYSQCL